MIFEALDGYKTVEVLPSNIYLMNYNTSLFRLTPHSNYEPPCNSCCYCQDRRPCMRNLNAAAYCPKATQQVLGTKLDLSKIGSPVLGNTPATYCSNPTTDGFNTTELLFMPVGPRLSVKAVLFPFKTTLPSCTDKKFQFLEIGSKKSGALVNLLKMPETGTGSTSQNHKMPKKRRNHYFLVLFAISVYFKI